MATLVDVARPRFGVAPTALRQLLPLVVLGIGLAYPLVDSSAYGLSRMILVLVYVVAALSLNFAFGYGGQLMLGQPVLLTGAAYTAGLLSRNAGWDWWFTVLVAVAVSIALSVFMALPSLRVRGWYLAVVSFLAVAIVPDVLQGMHTITGDSEGVNQIGPITFFGAPAPAWAVYELMFLTAVIVWLGIRNLVHSGWGRTLLMYRDHEVAATAAGVNQMRLRSAVYILHGIPCGLAGALYAHAHQFISPVEFNNVTVLLTVGSVFLGGAGTLWGPVIGSALFQGLSQFVGPFSPFNPLVLGIGVLVTALLFRKGIVESTLSGLRRIGAIKESPHHFEGDTLIEIHPIEKSPEIRVAGLRKQFAANVVLDGVELDVRGPSVTTVVGANGSGKTTLLNCISGFVVAEEGSIVIDGTDVRELRAHDRASRGVARSFQIPRLVDKLTVLENVEVGVFGRNPQNPVRALLRLPGFGAEQRRATERARAACRALGFGEDGMRTKASDLPLGLKRLVEIARALAADATVICLDEPVAGLNEAEQLQVAKVLRAIAESGRAVLLIEHNLEFVRGVSDEIMLLDSGRVADRGTPSATYDMDRPLGQYFQTFVAAAVRDGKNLVAPDSGGPVTSPAT